MNKRFTKYHKYGAYHWKWYKNSERYGRYKIHVDKVKGWVKEKNTLDVGAGDGLMAYVLGIKGIDNEPQAIKVGQRRGANVELGDAYDIDYKDEEFDAVFMGDVLEHLEFPEKALKEVRRILKKYLYLTVPIGKGDIDPFHYNKWDSGKLKRVVESIGFILEGEIEILNKKMYAKFKKI